MDSITEPENWTSQSVKKDANDWGCFVAQRVRQFYGRDAFAAAKLLGLQIYLCNHDELKLPVKRLAVWEGDTKTIKIFIEPLRQKFFCLGIGLQHICAHELFHAISAMNYKPLQISHLHIPHLTYHQEEFAAAAFSEAFLM